MQLPLARTAVPHSSGVQAHRCALISLSPACRLEKSSVMLSCLSICYIPLSPPPLERSTHFDKCPTASKKEIPRKKKTYDHRGQRFLLPTMSATLSYVRRAEHRKPDVIASSACAPLTMVGKQVGRHRKKSVEPQTTRKEWMNL